MEPSAIIGLMDSPFTIFAKRIEPITEKGKRINIIMIQKAIYFENYFIILLNIADKISL